MNNTNALPAKKPRDYAFDNLKALLIFLVVLGHVLIEGKSHEVVRILYRYIYVFHMPLFVFISGYFSKKAAKSFSSAVHSGLIPYVIFALLFMAVEWLIIPSSRAGLPGSLLEPPFTYWYLLCLFYWRLITPVLSKLKGFAFPVVFAAGLLIGLMTKGTATMSVARAFAFLPFYWMGFCFNSDTIAAIRKVNKVVSFIVFALASAGLVWLFVNVDIDYTSILQMRKGYTQCGFDVLSGMGVRLAAYAAAIIISFCLINLMPNKKFFFSYIGSGTISIYIGHGYLVYFVLRHFGVLDGVFAQLGSWASLGFCLLLAIAITFLFSPPFFTTLYKKITSGVSSLFTPKKDKAEKTA